MESAEEQQATAYPVAVEVKEDPTEVRYVLTQKGGQALLYGGHCFYKVRDGENRKTFWRCSKYRTESCEVRITTLEDQVVGVRGQHKHPAENNSDRIRASSETQMNWIRNRRRPNAAKMAEKMAEKIAAYGIPVTSSLPTTQLPTLIPSNPSLTPLTTLPHTVVVTATNHHMPTPGLVRVTETPNGGPHHSLPYTAIPQLTTAPEPKRICLEQNSHHMQLAPPPSTAHSSVLVVKVRVCGSGESDFVEVEVRPVTYQALLAVCCEELEVGSGDVAKIRKLPNVLVRKDRDVQRMREGQELEVVLKTEPSSASTGTGSAASPTPAASYPTTSMLTVNPFAATNAAAVLALSNPAIVQRGSNDGLPMKLPEENGMGNHVPVLTSDTSSELQSHTHTTTATVNGV